MYMPNRPDVRVFCISCMEEDFSVAQYMPEQIKIADDILNYQKRKENYILYTSIIIPKKENFV